MHLGLQLAFMELPGCKYRYMINSFFLNMYSCEVFNKLSLFFLFIFLIRALKMLLRYVFTYQNSVNVARITYLNKCFMSKQAFFDFVN